MGLETMCSEAGCTCDLKLINCAPHEQLLAVSSPVQRTYLRGLVSRTQRLVAASACCFDVSALLWSAAAISAPPSAAATTSTCPSQPLHTACQASASYT